jgi:serine/threonine protein kinase
MKLWRYGRAIERLGQRYRLEGTLGSGGMADVCLAWDEHDEREVAIKVMKHEEMDQRALDRFLKEGAKVAEWQHPNILRIYSDLKLELLDSAQGSIIPYIVMEYAAGGDLQKRLNPGQPYPLSATLSIFPQLCSAVSYAHSQGVIHRDLKPLNVLFRVLPDGVEEAVLSDFGLAVEVDATHYTYARGGTLNYMAPEQLQGQAEPASDIFALGVIFYQLCTGRMPFRRALIDLAQPYKPPIPPSYVQPLLPRALDQAVLKALAERPADRYTDALQFWESIQTALFTPPTTQGRLPTVHPRSPERDQPGASDPRSQRSTPAPHEAGGSDPTIHVSDSRGDLPDQGRDARSTWGGPEGDGGSSGNMGKQSDRGLRREPENRNGRESVIDYPEDFDVPPRSFVPDQPERQSKHNGHNGQRSDRLSLATPEFPITPLPPAHEDDPDDPNDPGTIDYPPSHHSPYSTSPRNTRDSLSNLQVSSKPLATPPTPHDDDPDTTPPVHIQTRFRRPGARTPGAGTPRLPAARRGRAIWHTRRSMLITLIVMILIVLIIGALFVFFSPLHQMIPVSGQIHVQAASNAGAATDPNATTVIITPASKTITHTYQLTVVATGGTIAPAPNQIAGPVIDTPTQSQQQTVTSTGTNQTNATQAKGTLTFFNGSFTTPFTVQAGTFLTGADGVVVVTDATITIPASNPNGQKDSSASVSAHAVSGGTKGNIPAMDIKQPCCINDNSVFVNNPAPFTGGQDGQSYKFLQQSDVDNADKTISGVLAEQELSSLRSQLGANALPPQVGSGKCSNSATADQPIGDTGRNVTSAVVTVSVGCRLEGYDHVAAQKMVATQLTQLAQSTLGAGYTLAGNVQAQVSAQSPRFNNNRNNNMIMVDARGVWVYQLSAEQQRQLASLIAGKSSADASQLLKQQSGISNVRIQNHSDTLPTDVRQIMIVIQPVPGLT